MSGYSRNPYSGYSGYGTPGSTHGSKSPEAAPSSYPQKDKDHTSAQHLEVLQKYHDDKRAEHGAMWRPPEQYGKDVALHKSLVSIEKIFPRKK